MLSHEQLADLQEHIDNWVREHLAEANVEEAEAAAYEIARACAAAAMEALASSTTGQKTPPGQPGQTC